MSINFITELERHLGKSITIIPFKLGVSIAVQYVVTELYSKDQSFLRPMYKFLDDSKYKIIHERDGNFLLIERRDKVNPEEFVKLFDKSYEHSAKIIESHRTDSGLFVVIKPNGESNGKIVLEDLRNCGFKIIDYDHLIIASAETTECQSR